MLFGTDNTFMRPMTPYLNYPQAIKDLSKGPGEVDADRKSAKNDPAV